MNASTASIVTSCRVAALVISIGCGGVAAAAAAEEETTAPAQGDIATLAREVQTPVLMPAPVQVPLPRKAVRTANATSVRRTAEATGFAAAPRFFTAPRWNYSHMLMLGVGF
jgi:hypothetical protein